MSKTYTYQPEKITDNGLNQMRFELGDTFTDMGEETCALCDEEYLAMIEKWQGKANGFKLAKIACLKAILVKLSYEVDYGVEHMRLELSQRYGHFKELLDSLEKTMQLPSGKFLGGCDRENGHYFYFGMQENRRTK